MRISLGGPQTLEDVKRQFHDKDGVLKDKLSIDHCIAAHVCSHIHRQLIGSNKRVIITYSHSHLFLLTDINIMEIPMQQQGQFPYILILS